jgi:hypothetical protein
MPDTWSLAAFNQNKFSLSRRTVEGPKCLNPLDRAMSSLERVCNFIKAMQV